jgi:NAD(P)-dependent dehydrogenase (short-subunit alcohol dehydrogenase family)
MFALLQALWNIIQTFFRCYQRIAISDPENHMIMITGCDSGFGLLTVYRCLSLRYYVVALCLTEKGVTELSEYVKTNGCSSHCQVMRCDVTKEEDLQGIYKKVESLLSLNKRLKLWSIVNNAGIAPSGFLDWFPMESLRRVMEVNFFSIVLVSKMFLPLMKRTKYSRFINVGSLAGHFGMPHGSGYCGMRINSLLFCFSLFRLFFSFLWFFSTNSL